MLNLTIPESINVWDNYRQEKCLKMKQSFLLEVGGLIR